MIDLRPLLTPYRVRLFNGRVFVADVPAYVRRDGRLAFQVPPGTTGVATRLTVRCLRTGRERVIVRRQALLLFDDRVYTVRAPADQSAA